MGMNVQVKLMEATPLTGGLLFSMQSPPRPHRKDLKAPEREQRSFRGNPARKRPSDGGGRPPGVRHTNQKGKASYGKNKKKKGR
jgi:ribonuclease R